jgi:hypothetical protein
MIKFVSDLGQVGGFLRALRFPPPIILTTSAGFRKREALGYATCEAPPSRLEEHPSLFNQF